MVHALKEITSGRDGRSDVNGKSMLRTDRFGAGLNDRDSSYCQYGVWVSHGHWLLTDLKFNVRLTQNIHDNRLDVNMGQGDLIIHGIGVSSVDKAMRDQLNQANMSTQHLFQAWNIFPGGRASTRDTNNNHTGSNV